MFLILRGKPTGGPNGVPQSYVTTASNVLSSLFALSLNTAITVAFTQHLWLIFREKAFKVSTIEALYKSRCDPLSLTALDCYRQAPLLILIATFGWTISIAASFPPGAFTVQNALLDSVENVTVPTFDPYYVGNGEYNQLIWNYCTYCVCIQCPLRGTKLVLIKVHIEIQEAFSPFNVLPHIL